VWASLLKGKTAVIQEVAEEMDRRDLLRSLTRVALTDGERALQIRVEQKLKVTLILDLMHALEKLWNQAYKSGDTKALASILDDAIVLINDDGRVQTKKEFLPTVKATNAQEQQVAPEFLKVYVHGDVAVATGVLRVKGVEGGKSYSRRERFVDTWLRKRDNWVCIATNATPITH